MSTILASLVLASVLPTNLFNNVCEARYWQKADAWGVRDDSVSAGVPNRYPAFALTSDTFILVDPLVRTSRLDRVEVYFGKRVYPAREVSRTEIPDTVTIQTETPVEGISPIVWGTGAPVCQVEWAFSNGSLVARPGSVSTNSWIGYLAETKKPYSRRPSETLYLNEANEAVALDMGHCQIGPDGAGFFVCPADWPKLPVDTFECAASGIEARAASAAVSVFVHLNPESKESRSSRMFRFSSESDKDNQDTVGLYVNGHILVPISLSGEEIGRLAQARATGPDGETADLTFEGALAEWNALVFACPPAWQARLQSLEVALDDPYELDGQHAWTVTVENMNGQILARGERAFFGGIQMIRDAKRVPGLNSRRYVSYSSSINNSKCKMVLDTRGRLVIMDLARRFNQERWSRSSEFIEANELASALRGERFNAEFKPRDEDARNRLVWLGVETTELTVTMAREKKAQSFMKNYSRCPLVSEVFPESPAAKAGLRVGDVLLAVRRGVEAERDFSNSRDSYSSFHLERIFGEDGPLSILDSGSVPWSDVEGSVNRMLTVYGVGSTVTVVYARDGERCEVPVVLEAAPVHYQNAPRARNRTLGLSVKDITFEVRRFLKIESNEPGVIIAKVKPGSPAAVAGLKPFEVITEVNGAKIEGAKDFAAKVKGQTDLILSVRRLAVTRLVKIQIQAKSDK